MAVETGRLHDVTRSARQAASRLRHRTATVLAPAVHAGLCLVATDVSEIVTAGRLLVVSPHPDDETLACGALLAASASRGLKPVIVCVTDGRYGLGDLDPEECARLRRSELAASAESLGIAPDHVIMLRYEDSTVRDHVDELAEDLSDLARELRPEVLVAPSPFDIHADHCAVADATRRVAQTLPVRHLEYVVWGWQHPVSWMATVHRRHGLGRPVKVRAGPAYERKLAALACYRSQVGLEGPLGTRFLRSFTRRHELFFETRGRPSRGRRPAG